MPKAILLSLLLAATSLAHAQRFDSRFEEGYTLLRAGDPDGALESFRELLTEDPESQYIKYSIATAQYAKGLKSLEIEASEEGVEQLYQARDGFDALRNTKDPFLQKNVSFNAANSTAQVAKHYDPHDQYNERVQALRDAIAAYEKVLRQQPDHAGAKTNLNHARYLFKTMLQDPPPDQQNADDEGGEEGEEGQNEQQSEEGENSEQEGQEGEEEPPEGEDESDSENDSSGGDPQDASAQTEPLEDQNIEAILQSLEDKNREEQKNLRKAKGPPEIRGGKWW
ncbi:MAG: tetratricopeptide repeat protein [Candidatus Hydrogenedentes bacterium]|nr:tetratricopeptide repeat protein [Candidatus Hydrogenedentota bacterium]